MITFFKNSRQNGYNFFTEEVQVFRFAFKKDLGEDYIRQFASCCQQKNKPGLVECEEDSPPLVQRKKKKTTHKAN